MFLLVVSQLPESLSFDLSIVPVDWEGTWI